MDSDREFLLKLLHGLLNIKEQFDSDLKKVVGPPYYLRKGNLEVIDSVCQKIRDHLAIQVGMEQINGVKIVTDLDCPPNQMYMIPDNLERSWCGDPMCSKTHIWTDGGMPKQQRWICNGTHK